MEATKETVQEQQEPTQTKNLGNNVPNTFEELNAMRQNQNLSPYPNTLNKTQSTFAQNANSILQSSTQYKSKEDPVNRFAKSMNLPKDVSIVKMPKNVEKTKYQIPPSEYIWDAPYLKKTQIFPSYVRNNIYLINILFIFR
jgi:hypothetical protein